MATIHDAIGTGTRWAVRDLSVWLSGYADTSRGAVSLVAMTAMPHDARQAAKRHFNRGLELPADTGSCHLELSTMSRLGHVYYMRGDGERALETTRRELQGLTDHAAAAAIHKAVTGRLASGRPWPASPKHS